ncbi:hypothetical protein NPIL_680681 [Nephila pilipes]|uniref:Uncharacterized protein n=1 Tax=Nephila pilipes TaxID=299642 RepID=A0A8X6NSN6_NEPPI|nr:hypothetical protein NPIL_680681 [Nephila pilipes]
MVEDLREKYYDFLDTQNLTAVETDLRDCETHIEEIQVSIKLLLATYQSLTFSESKGSKTENSNHSKSQIKLPKIPLPTFNGKFDEWYTLKHLTPKTPLDASEIGLPHNFELADPAYFHPAGQDSPEKVIAVSRQTTFIMEKAEMNLLKWISNDPHLMLKYQEEEFRVRPIYPDTCLVKVLGLSWNPKDDQFNLDINRVLEMVALPMDTKRSLLKAGKYLTHWK